MFFDDSENTDAMNPLGEDEETMGGDEGMEGAGDEDNGSM